MITQSDNFRVATKIVTLLQENDMWSGSQVYAGNVRYGDCVEVRQEVKTPPVTVGAVGAFVPVRENLLLGYNIYTPLVIECFGIREFYLYHPDEFDRMVKEYDLSEVFWESFDEDHLYLCVPEESYCEFESGTLVMLYEINQVQRASEESPATPEEIKDIMGFWYAQSEKNGDKGSVVVGAGLEFWYNSQKYFMPACSPWQGSLSWEVGIENVIEKLRDIGAERIIYNPGRMD